MCASTLVEEMAAHQHRDTLSQALAIQRRVIWALFLRESLTRYGRHNIGFLWLIVEPMIFTLGITAFWTVTKAVHGSDLPIVPFAITGYSSVLMWRNMPGRLANALEPNIGLMHHRNVRLIDVYASRLMLEVGGVTVSFVFLTLFFAAIDWLVLPEDLLQVIFGWVLIIWFGTGLGLVIGSLSEQSEIFERIWHPATYLIFPLSGAAFIVDALPQAMQTIVLYLPMVHCVEIIREGFFGSSFVAHYDIEYVFACNLILSLFGLLNTRKVSREIILE